MTEMLRIEKSLEEGIMRLLKNLLKSNKVGGVFALKRLSENRAGNAFEYSLITDVDALEGIAPLFPIMPRNAGGLLAHLTQKGEVPSPIAVFIRPCEIRALVELAKRNRSNPNNLFIISSTCAGVFPTKMMINGELRKNIFGYWEAIKRNEIPEKIKHSCKACNEFVPYNSDMTVMVIGKDDFHKKCDISLNTPRAREFADMIQGKIIDNMPLTIAVEKIHKDRIQERQRQFDELGIGSFDLHDVVNIFGKCINCHGCRTVCPICYCELCSFSQQSPRYQLSETELKRKGAIRVPPETTLYHFTRMLHVSISCVGCGSCEDVCPADIPLSRLFKKVGGDVQELFNYLPGRDIDEEIPLKTFELDEYSEVED